MTIDVSTILKEIGGRIDIDGNVMLSDTDFLGEMYHFDDPVRIKGHISNNGKSLILNAECTGHMTTQCARCMKDIDVPVKFEIDENLAQDDGESSYDDEVILFDDVKIDIDDIAANNFLMNVEGKYLCSEDCKGLCPQCGADLNEGDCGCGQDNVDPRWAALVDIMNKDK
ncbi:MAG: YceD family protein [Hominilimicola sp.]